MVGTDGLGSGMASSAGAVGSVEAVFSDVKVGTRGK